MSGVSADIVSEIILNTWFKYPQLFASNYTLGEIFSFVRLNTTILSAIANATRFDEQKLGETIDLYLTVVYYLQQTTAPTPAVNTTNSTQVVFCTPEVGQGVLTSFSLLPAFLILILLSCLNKRSRKVKLCGRTISRPGLCIPVNLVDSYENRFAFACAFGATTTKCLTILFLGNYEEIFSTEFNAWIQRPEVPSDTGIVWRIIAMFVIGIAYYPLFACMATDYKITGFIIGVIYSGLWIVSTISRFWQCPEYNTLVFPGDVLASEMPIFLCLFYLFLKYIWLLIKAVYSRYRPNASPKHEENEWMTFYKYRYVVKLLEPIPKEQREPGSLRQRVKGKLYKWKPEFKYSTRVVCTYFISFIGVYEILILFIILGGILLKTREEIPEATLAVLDNIRQWLLIGGVSVFVSVAISGIYTVVLVANMLSWYRGHLLRLQRGEKGFLPLEIFNRNPSSITVATLKYSGFQVAYLCWGSTITVLFLSVVGFVIGEQIILPIVDRSLDTFVWAKLRDLWPGVVISLVFVWIQTLLAKYAFLMDRGSTMALDNRRLFHVCTYFLFFFNIFLGVVSCLKRVIIGAVLGVMFLGRTQKSVLSRDFELMDPGFNAYVGYLLLEHTHSNPVLVTFCQLLIKTIIDRQTLEHVQGETNGETNLVMVECTNNRVGIELGRRSLQRRKSMRIRNRWHLFLTLHNNPSLQEHRRRDMFVERSPFAAFGVMIQHGGVQINHALENDREANAYDEKL